MPAGRSKQRLACAPSLLVSSLNLKDRRFRQPGLSVSRLSAQDLVEIGEREIELMRILADRRSQ
jgi:hypothetical protein